MSVLSILKVLGPIAVLALVVIGLLDWLDLRKAAKDWSRCEAAASADAEPTTPCAEQIRAAIELARRSRACELALGEKKPDLYVIRATCPAKVKKTYAALAAAEASLADAQAQLLVSEARARDAGARGEARGIAQTNRKATHDATIKAAPRATDGDVRCDAECLRGLSIAAPGR